MKTTLNAIKTHGPCCDGWKTLLRSLNKTEADDEPVSIIQILDSNGLDDAIWCLRAVDGRDKEIRLFAVLCARQVEHLMTDQRSKDALNVVERFANGDATQEELAAAGDVAGAAWAAAWAARSARSAWASWTAWTAGSARSAWAAAGAAARAARTSSSAGDAARAAQEKELRRICLKSQEEK